MPARKEIAHEHGRHERNDQASSHQRGGQGSFAHRRLASVMAVTLKPAPDRRCQNGGADEDDEERLPKFRIGRYEERNDNGQAHTHDAAGIPTCLPKITEHASEIIQDAHQRVRRHRPQHSELEWRRHMPRQPRPDDEAQQRQPHHEDIKSQPGHDFPEEDPGARHGPMN